MYIMERRATVHWVQSIPSIGKAMPWRDNGITMERQFPSMIILTITTDSIQTVTGIALHPKNLTKQ